MLVPVMLGEHDGLQGSLPLATVTLLVLDQENTDNAITGNIRFTAGRKRNFASDNSGKLSSPRTGGGHCDG